MSNFRSTLLRTAPDAPVGLPAAGPAAHADGVLAAAGTRAMAAATAGAVSQCFAVG
ncbi:hypothetical protein GTW71_12585, partial [Streptomyces sp. SID6041]|nr:hypothetical protein [Streptomyces sp. SID6041]